LSDVVVTVPKSFRYGGETGLRAWLKEGCLVGEEDDDQLGGYVFSTWGLTPAIVPGERVYVLCEKFIRGYAPLTQLRANYGRGRVEFIRGGGAVAVTIRGPDGLPLPVVGFRGWKYRWWQPEDEMPFPEWMTYGVKVKP
jgi:hypothetical protein